MSANETERYLVQLELQSQQMIQGLKEARAGIEGIGTGARQILSALNQLETTLDRTGKSAEMNALRLNSAQVAMERLQRTSLGLAGNTRNYEEPFRFLTQGGSWKTSDQGKVSWDTRNIEQRARYWENPYPGSPAEMSWRSGVENRSPFWTSPYGGAQPGIATESERRYIEERMRRTQSNVAGTERFAADQPARTRAEIIEASVAESRASARAQAELAMRASMQREIDFPEPTNWDLTPSANARRAPGDAVVAQLRERAAANEAAQRRAELNRLPIRDQMLNEKFGTTSTELRNLGLNNSSIKMLDEATKGAIGLDEAVRRLKSGDWTSKQFNDWSQSIDKTGMSMAGLAKHVAIYWGLYMAIQQVAVAAQALADNMLKVDAAGARAAYSMGISQEAGRGLALDAMATGARYGQGPTEAIGAFQQAARYSKDSATQQALIGTSAQMAMLTGGNQADAMQDLITVTRQWNLETSQIPQVLDLVAMAAKNTNVDLGDYVDSLSKGAIVGKAMGLDMSQTAGLYAGFLQMSGKSASETTTFLERIATIGQRPTDVSKLVDAGILRENEKMTPWEVLQRTKQSWGGLNDTQRSNVIEAFGGQRQLENVLTLINNFERLNELMAKFNGYAGEGANATNALMNSLEAQANRVFPTIGALMTKALTPSGETYEGATRFLTWLNDQMDAMAKNRKASELLGSALTSPFLGPSFGFGKFGFDVGRTAADAITGRETGTPGASEDSGTVLEYGRKSYQAKNWKTGAAGSSGSDISPMIVDTTKKQTALNFGGLDITKDTRSEFEATRTLAANLSQQYIKQVETLDPTGEAVKKIREEWEKTVLVMRLANGEIVTMQGGEAALYKQAAQLRQQTQKPSISFMPEMNAQNFQKYTQYVRQYERVLNQMGVPQESQTFLMQGQGGEWFKSVTSQEANTLALELLREELKKNTEGQLRGHWNIPTAFGYKPPTVWEYYNKTGSHEMGPVNYPWMNQGPTDSKGKPIVGSVGTGITASYTSSLVSAIQPNVTALGNNTAAVTMNTAALGKWAMGEKFSMIPSGSTPAQTAWALGEKGLSVPSPVRRSGTYAPGPGFTAAPSADKTGIMSLADRMSSEYGIKDPNILRSIIQAESNWNPNAVGDNGNSIGLLQNNMAGGRGKGHTKANLLDPEYNLRIGMKEIKNWYDIGTERGLQGADLARFVGQKAQRPAAGMEEGYARAYTQLTSASGSGSAHGGLSVQGMSQLQSSTQQIAPSVNALRGADQAGFSRMASAQITTNSLLSNAVTQLARIATLVGKPPTVIVQGTGSASLGKASVQQASESGLGRAGVNGNPGRYLG